jgi:hypothetical protein
MKPSLEYVELYKKECTSVNITHSLPGATTHVGSWPTQEDASNYVSLALILQFLTPSFSASLITPSIHLRFGLPARLLPSGLSKVIFLRSYYMYCPS